MESYDGIELYLILEKVYDLSYDDLSAVVKDWICYDKRGGKNMSPNNWKHHRCVALVMDYLADASWVDRHVAITEWQHYVGKLHKFWLKLFYRINDQRAEQQIRDYVRRFVSETVDASIWASILPLIKGVFTGSALFAFLHIQNGGSVNEHDIFRFNDLDFFGLGCEGLKDLLSNNCMYNHVETVHRSTKAYPNASCVSLNFIDIQQKVVVPPPQNDGLYVDPKYTDPGLEAKRDEDIHTYCLRSFDIDILANTYDGERLRIGDDSWSIEQHTEFRTRICMRLGVFRMSNPNKETMRYRVKKYVGRKFTFVDQANLFSQLEKPL